MFNANKIHSIYPVDKQFSKGENLLSKLVKLDISLILKKLVPVLQSHERVEGAYIFGSILEQCRTDSDIDVGIILTPKISYSEKNVELILA